MVRYNLHDGTMARTESVAGASEPPPRTHTVIRTPVRPHTRPAPPLQWRGGGAVRLRCLFVPHDRFLALALAHWDGPQRRSLFLSQIEIG